ncbi:MAG: NAD(P)H-hydrate dehydratase [Pirellulales bacterium]
MTDVNPFPKLPAREVDSHKGDFGRVFFVGGSVGMAGSIALAGLAALRCGAGLVTIATPRDCLDVVASFCPSYMTLPLPCDAAGVVTIEGFEKLVGRLEKANVVGCGPGLSQSRGVSGMVLRLQRELDLPIVFDADALNVLAQQPDALQESAGPRVLTPHLGEFARLVQVERVEAAEARAQAVEQAKHWKSVVVLKGPRTLVTDGDRVYENQSGNAGLATGGTGDVLTGIITSLIGQGLAPFDAAQLGVYLQGLAGDLAADVYGQAGMISEDLIELLPQACRQVME